MPGVIQAIEHTRITADLVRKSKRHLVPSGALSPSYLAGHKSGSSAGPSFATVVFDTVDASAGADLSLDTGTGIVTVNTAGCYSFVAQAQFPLATAGDELQVYVIHAAPWWGLSNAQVEATGTYQKVVEVHAPTTWYAAGDTFTVQVAHGPSGTVTLVQAAFIAARVA